MPAYTRAILDLKNQRDKLHQYQKRITVLTDSETRIAKECLARDDRRRALLALRRKKYQESLLAKSDAQLAQLEQLVGQVEFSLVQKDILFGLQQGTQVLQAINKEMGGLEGVEKLMGETEDARLYQEVTKRTPRITKEELVTHLTMAIQEISQMLAGHLSNQDEDEVEEELAALQGPVVLPSAPTTTLPEEEKEEQEEVEASTAEASIETTKQGSKAKTKARTAVPAS